MSSVIEDQIRGVRVVRAARRGVRGLFDDAGLIPHPDEGPARRAHTRQRPNDLVTAEFEPGGIAVRGPDGAFLLGNRGTPVVVPAETTLATRQYPLLQVHWHDDQARPGLLTLGARFPVIPTGTTPTNWPALVAHLEWSQGSSNAFTADVDMMMGLSFPITFSSLSVMVQKDWQLTAPPNDLEVTAFGGVAPCGYGGFGAPTKTYWTGLTGSVVTYTGQVKCPPFATMANISWDAPQTSALTVNFLMGGYGYALVRGKTYMPATFAGPVPPIKIPNNCYGLSFSSDYAAVVNTVFDLGIR